MSTATKGLTIKLYDVITGGQGVPPGSFISFVGGGIALDSAHMKWATQLPPYVGNSDANNAYSFANMGFRHFLPAKSPLRKSFVTGKTSMRG